MRSGEPRGWRRLQQIAQRETDPKKLAGIIDKMNALLTEEEKKAKEKSQSSSATKRGHARP